jgi:hypothetical protein
MRKKLKSVEEAHAAKTPRRGRVDVAHLVMAVALLGWGVLSLFRNKFQLGVRGRILLGFQDRPAWLMAGAVACGAIVLVAVALRKSPAFAQNTPVAVVRWLGVRLGWCFFVSAVVAQTYLHLTH